MPGNSKYFCGDIVRFRLDSTMLYGRIECIQRSLDVFFYDIQNGDTRWRIIENEIDAKLINQDASVGFEMHPVGKITLGNPEE